MKVTIFPIQVIKNVLSILNLQQLIYFDLFWLNPNFYSKSGYIISNHLAEPKVFHSL
jgi:hypothetical protein